MNILKQPVIPSIKSSKDYRIKEVETPEKLSYCPHIPFIFKDQGQTPHCVGFTGAHIVNTYQNFIGENDVIDPHWLYHECKKVDGMPDADGTQIKVMLDILKDKGYIKAYYRLDGVEEIKQSLAQGMLIAVGTLVTSDNWLDGDRWVIEPEGFIKGAHATMLYGYDDALSKGSRKGFFNGLNSWGEEWGEGGHYLMAYDYVTWKSDIGMDAVMEAWGVEFESPLTYEKEEETLQLRKGKIQFAVMHHTAKLNEYTAEETKRVHLARGFGDVGYNYLIERDGKIVKGRDEKWRGAHVVVEGADNPQYWNDNALGVCLVHNGEESEFPEVMYQSAAKLLKAQGFKAPQIRLHGEVDATACPGKYFNKSKLLKYLNKEWESDIVMPEDSVSNWAKAAHAWVVKEGITDGTRPKEPVTREELWTMIYRMEGKL